jgi:hypothetical protein
MVVAVVVARLQIEGVEPPQSLVVVDVIIDVLHPLVVRVGTWPHVHMVMVVLVVEQIDVVEPPQPLVVVDVITYVMC